MIKSLSAFVLTVLFSSQVFASPSSAPTASGVCPADDLSCIRRLLLQKNDELQSWAREAGLLKTQVELVKQENGLLRAENESLRSVLQPALDAAKAAQRPFYESPAFLIPVGVAGGVLLTVVAIFGISQLRVTAH